MTHLSFATTEIGLDRSSPPLRLYEKAKKYGVWNPSDIDLTQDQHDWQALQADEKDLLWRLTAMFQAGEEAVTLDLLPLIMVIAKEGRLEEEMFLTTFLFEEAKHTDFFNRFLDEVTGKTAVLSHYHSDNYRTIFYETLPNTLQALLTDSSPTAQIKAAVTYNMIVEGVLAETGYHGYFTVLQRNNIMPGVQKGITLLKQDESRHIAYGIYLISRLVAEQPHLWNVVEETMNELLPTALDVVGDTFLAYGDHIPFDLEPADFTTFALSQFQKRIDRIEKAKTATLTEVQALTQHIIDDNDG